jgi:hypothetical protein
MYIVPEWPLFFLAGIQAVKYFWQFWKTRQEHIPTNYILLGKSFSWFLLGCVYLWASFQPLTNFLAVRNYVRLANILWILTDLTYFSLTTYLNRKYSR